MVCNDPLIPVFHQSGAIWGMVIFIGGHRADYVLIVSSFSLCEVPESTGGLCLRMGGGRGRGVVVVEVKVEVK